MEEPARPIAESPVPIALWVGPSRARLYGTPAQLLAVADVTGMAPGAASATPANCSTRPGVDVDFGDATARCGRSRSASATPATSACCASGSATRDPDADEHGQRPRRLRRGGRHVRTTEDEVLDDGTVRSRRSPRCGSRACRSSTACSTPSPVRRSPTSSCSSGSRSSCSSSSRPASASPASSVPAPSCWRAPGCRPPGAGWAVGLIIASMLAFAVDVQVGIPGSGRGSGSSAR